MQSLPKPAQSNAGTNPPHEHLVRPTVPHLFSTDRAAPYRRAIFFIIFIAICAARLSFMPPQTFVEGDDASLCAGITRLCTPEDIGPYLVEPPYIPATGAPQLVFAKLLAKPQVAKIYLYRYHTMPGMYLLGRMACFFKQDIAQTMSWLCFAAGTLMPIFLSLFLMRSFGWLPPAVFPLCYAMIALSPEAWVSGSAYINDKIVASCLLAASLWITAALRQGSAKRHWLSVFLAGVTFGGSILMRSDSVIFAPALLLVLFTDLWQTSPRCWAAMARSGGLFVLTSILTLLAVSRYMDSSLLIALFEIIRVGLPQPIDFIRKIPVFLSSYGWAQLITFAGLTIVLGGTLFRQRTLARSGPPSRPYRNIFLAFLLIFPEVYSAINFPVASQKYLLVSSSVVAGLCCLLPFWLRQRQQQSSRLSWLIITLPMLFLAAGAFIPLGKTDVGVDGERSIGGQLAFTISAHPDSDKAKALVALLEHKPPSFSGNVVVKDSTWLFRQTIAYESVRRGWHNKVVFTTEAIPVHHNFRQFFDHIARYFDLPEFYQNSVYIAFNAYSPANSANVAIWLPSSLMGDKFSPEILAKTVPSPSFIIEYGAFSEGINTLKRSP